MITTSSSSASSSSWQDDHNVNIQVAASKSFCGSSLGEREREGRRRQEDFLPRLVGLCDHHVDSVDDDHHHVDHDVDDHHHHVDRVDDDVDDNIFVQARLD